MNNGEKRVAKQPVTGLCTKQQYKSEQAGLIFMYMAAVVEA
jgi:hypothetical protein